MARAFSCLSSLTNEVVHTCSTIGSNAEEVVLQKIHFLLWDLGGQEALRSAWDTYNSNTETLQDASVLIFASKQDVKDSMTTAEISQFLTGTAIKDHPRHIQGCCAFTGEGSALTTPLPGPANGQKATGTPLLSLSSQNFPTVGSMPSKMDTGP
ncbi:putative ADP-ribosylation factor-like protein 5C isoform X2 [Mesocricetus auratus]|uniref:ADP-ribosylation factor-like protein 5C isoform X2 n=1 Tax=Mesocricetus auratus TaxID=10036 RepID=A0A3Q0D059_MESAU|nr:putative ADP-ribosylation factor-like protein 5C isoform X2 [Mesocricetus auratus]